MYYWNAYAEYSDGTTFEKNYPYLETNYREEEERQFELEAMLVEKKPGCTYYSVSCIWN